jgi:membrane dipeptidase
MASVEENMIICAAPEQLSALGIKAVLAIESGDTIDCRVGIIQYAFELGARMMSLTWNVENDFGYGCHCRGGLKIKGIEAVRELNRLRMALDVSHLSYEGFWDAAAIYVYPPCASHSCCYSITPNRRNLKDDQIEYIIKNNGYIGVNFYTEFLKGEKASVGDILDHIEHILYMGGQNCAGLGSDFCGIQYTPSGLDSVADFQKIPEAMAKRNYNDDLISQICYSNLERYLLKFL